MKIKQMVLIGFFVACIAVGAFIKISIGTTPFTLQPLFIMLTALVLDPKSAFYSVFIYLFIGLIGLPVFAKGGGIGYVLQPSFGYLIGFLFAVVFISNLKDKINKIIVCVIGIGIIYFFGVLYFVLIQNHIYGKLFPIQFIISNLVLVFLPSDVISMVLALMISKKIKNRYA